MFFFGNLENTQLGFRFCLSFAFESQALVSQHLEKKKLALQKSTEQPSTPGRAGSRGDSQFPLPWASWLPGYLCTPWLTTPASWECVINVPITVLQPSGCFLALSHHICYLHGSCSQKKGCNSRESLHRFVSGFKTRSSQTCQIREAAGISILRCISLWGL